MTLEEIETLIGKSRLSEADKVAILEEADAVGIDYVIRKNCRRCYDEVLMKLFERLNSGNVNYSVDGYRLRNAGDDFTVCGVRYNNATISGQEVGTLREVVVSQLFVRDEVRG